MTEEWVRGTRPSGKPREEALAPQNGAPKACNLSPTASFLLGVSSFPGEEQAGPGVCDWLFPPAKPPKVPFLCPRVPACTSFESPKRGL